VLLIVRPEAITRAKLWVAVAEELSVTRTVKLKVPALVGMPLIIPPLLNVRPGGKPPDASDQLYGCTPPLALSVCE